MPTHQSLSGASDEDLLQRMVKTHPDRFDAGFWTFFDASVAPALPARPVILDVGCGPGLFLRDLGLRYPDAPLHGYDVTTAMVEFGRALPWPGAKPSMAVLDVTTTPLPHPAGSVHLLSMSSVLHVIDEPLPVLEEIRRVLAPNGIFLLHDWIRQSLPAYLTQRREVMKDDGPDATRRAFRLFPVHNKYTPGDWQFLLDMAGFTIRHRTQQRASHQVMVATLAGQR